MPRVLLSFCGSYQPAEAHVVNLALKKTVEVGKTRVHFIPYWELLRKSF